MTPEKKVGTAKKAAGRPRDDEARTAILQAVLALVKEVGYRSLTFDKLAERSGSAKATIYRWWPSKAAVVMEAYIVCISPQIPFASVSTGTSACESIEKQMRSLIHMFNGKHGGVLRALIAESQFDAELSRTLIKDWFLPRRAMATGILQAGIQAGELRTTLDPDMMIDALYGSLYYRLLMPYAALTSRLAQELVEAILKPQRQ